MTAGTDQLAACTVLEDLRDIKDILDVEAANYKASYDEYMAKYEEHTLKAGEFRMLARECTPDIHDVPKLIKDRGYEIEYG